MTVEQMLAEIKAGVDSVNGRLMKHASRLDAVEKVLKSRSVSLPGVDEGKEKFSFARAIYAIARRDFTHAPFERDVFAESEKRALSAGQDTAGGYIVPAQYVAELIDLLRSKVVVQEMGATSMPNLTNSPVEVPKLKGGATGAWVGENDAITESQQNFGQLSLTPKQASGFVKVSNRAVNLSNPAIETIVRDDLTKVIARLIDLAALRGIGSENQPLGIANTPGINTVTIADPDGGEISYDFLVDMITKLDEDDALEGKLGFIMHPLIKAKIAKLKDADQRPLFQWDPSVQQPTGSLIGYPWKTTSQIPTNLTKGAGTNLSEIYFANWADLVWATWGGLTLDASREAGTAFQNNQTWIRIIQEVDIGLRHEQSFCLINDAETV